jgi:hypothetical protein
MIKGLSCRVDMRIFPQSLIEDPESLQYSLMELIDQLYRGDIDPKRGAVIVRALHVGVRNLKNLQFDCLNEAMVRDMPDYHKQYRDEHPEIWPPQKKTRKAAADASTQTPHPGYPNDDQANQDDPNANDADTPASQPAIAASASSSIRPNTSVLLSRNLPPKKSSATHAIYASVPHLPASKFRSPKSQPTSPKKSRPRRSPQPTNSSQPARSPQPANSSIIHPDIPLTTRQQSQWNQLRNLEASLHRAERGSLPDVKKVFRAAGILESRSHREMR